MNGLQTNKLSNRRGGASWDNKINVLQTAVGIAANKGKVGTTALEVLRCRLH
jgi:hypothetical protein